MVLEKKKEKYQHELNNLKFQRQEAKVQLRAINTDIKRVEGALALITELQEEEKIEDGDSETISTTKE